MHINNKKSYLLWDMPGTNWDLTYDFVFLQALRRVNKLIHLAHITNRINIAGFFVALGNAWGLFLIIILIGYGLVAIPKLLWRAKSVKGRY